MKGLEFDPITHTLRIIDGSREVLVAAGTMVSLLTTLETFASQPATFPDFSKDNLYIWTSAAKVALSTLGKGEAAACYITALPQEYSDVTVLMDAPDGADIFWGQFKLDRTTDPANTWMGRTLGVLPPEGQWMPINGAASVLVEAEVDMSRALHIYIDDDPLSANYRKLVMEVEQSVGPAIGGYTTMVNQTDSLNYYDSCEAVNSNDDANASFCGIPIFLRSSGSYGYNNSAWGGGPLFSSNRPTTMRHDGGSAVARNDTTDYQSIYTLDIRGRFGRRS